MHICVSVRHSNASPLLRMRRDGSAMALPQRPGRYSRGHGTWAAGRALSNSPCILYLTCSFIKCHSAHLDKLAKHTAEGQRPR